MKAHSKTETGDYIRKSEEALGAAKALEEHNHPSAALSMAYYAMFYAVKAILLTKDISTTRHASTLTLFNQHFIKEKIIARWFYKMIIRAYQERLKADYDASSRASPEEAAARVRDAEQFVDEIKRYLGFFFTAT